MPCIISQLIKLQSLLLISILYILHVNVDLVNPTSVSVLSTWRLFQILSLIEQSQDCPLAFVNCSPQFVDLKFGTPSAVSMYHFSNSTLISINSVHNGHQQHQQKIDFNGQTKFGCNHVKYIVCLPASLNLTEMKQLGRRTQPKYDLYIFLSQGPEKLVALLQQKPIVALRFKAGLDLAAGYLYQERNRMLISTDVIASSSGIPYFDQAVINLNGQHLKVSSNTLKPFILVEEEEGRQVMKGGTHYTILKYGSENYNFSLEYDIDPKRGSGKKLENGSYNGMMGDVLTNGFDIALITRLVEGQVGILDMTTFNSIDTLVFLIQHPKTHLEWEAMMYSFTPSTWITIFVTFLGVTGTYSLYFIKGQQRQQQQQQQFYRNPGDDSSHPHSWFDAFKIPFATGLSQVTKIPKKTYILTSAWLLFILNINIAYNSNLISYLNFPTQEAIPRSFKELSEALEYNITFNYISSGQCYCYTFFTTSKSALYKKITNRFDPNNLEPDTASCVIRAALKPKNVCVGWRSVTSIAIATNATIYHYDFKPLLRSSPAYVSYNSIGFNKNSKFTNSFSRFIGMLRDTGIVTRLYSDALGYESWLGRKWRREHKREPETANLVKSLKTMMNERFQSTKAFKFENFFFHFAVLIVGLVLGFGMFLVEILSLLCCKY